MVRGTLLLLVAAPKDAFFPCQQPRKQAGRKNEGVFFISISQLVSKIQLPTFIAFFFFELCLPNICAHTLDRQQGLESNRTLTRFVAADRKHVVSASRCLSLSWNRVFIFQK